MHHQSWWLKIKRAQKHMVDIRREARRYAESNPYEYVRIPYPDRKNTIRHRLKIVRHPDPVVGLLIGDFAHNLRSALDHVVWAATPKKSRSNRTSFPVAYRDIFAKDADGNFVVDNADARSDFEWSVRGLPADALAVVKRAQPYQGGSNANRTILGVLSRLDNTDKHRTITAIGGGVMPHTMRVHYIPTGEVIEMPHRVDGPPLQYAKDGTIVVQEWGTPVPGLDLANIPRPSEVDMEYRGTTLIVVDVTSLGGKYPTIQFRLGDILFYSMRFVRRNLRLLERFV